MNHARAHEHDASPHRATPRPGPSATDPAAIRALFRDRGLRITRQRELLYARLASTDQHPTADQLRSWLVAEGDADGHAGLSVATVYNALEAFTRAGIARRIPCEGSNGPARYDADVSPHVHLTLADGRVVDAPPELSRRLLGQLDGAALSELDLLGEGTVTRLSIELSRDPAG